MSSSNDVAVAVIGRGLIGSAAARHLAEAGVLVALIGPSEPVDYTASTGPFSSHFDQGRITRISSGSMYWAELAARSIGRYRDIADRSGIGFHDPRGLAQISGNVDACIANARARGGDARAVTREWLRATTGIAVRDDHPGDVFYEGSPAGVINPRQLLAAQCMLTAAAGATIVDAAATGVRSTASGFEIDAGDTSISADQIILATGAYGASLVGVDLAIERRLRTVVFAELGPGAEIPTLIDDSPAHAELDEIYWVPPVAFPDGRMLLKIGGNSLPMITADTDADITSWFHAGGSEREAVAFQETIRALLPDADITGWDHKPCVVSYTDAELPYLGFVDDGVVVALGASGSGAKSSDELGRLAASLVTPTGWSGGDLDLEAFTPQLA